MKASKEGGRGREKGRQREGILAKNVFIFFKQKWLLKEEIGGTCRSVNLLSTM